MPTYLCSSVDPKMDFYYCPGAQPEFQRIPDKKPLDPKIIPSIRIEVFKALSNQLGQNPPFLTSVSIIEVPHV